jgi:hypothetical protein
MDALEVRDLGLGRGPTIQREVGIVERGQNSGQALWPFRVANAGRVLGHVGVGEQGDGHVSQT